MTTPAPKMPRALQFPPYCPECKRLLAVSAERHCGKRLTRYCRWLTCSCGANVAEVAR